VFSDSVAQNNRPERLACIPTFLKKLIYVSWEHRLDFRYAYINLVIVGKGVFLNMAALDFQLRTGMKLGLSTEEHLNYNSISKSCEAANAYSSC